MYMHMRHGILLALLAAAVVGCATPGPVIRLSPSSPDAIWISGRSVVAKEVRGVRVAAAFDHQTPTTVGMRVEIENQTDERMEVTTSQVIFVTCRSVNICSTPLQVIDPEEMLLALDHQRARQEADAADSAVLGASLLFLSFFTDVATVASGHADSTTGLQTEAIASEFEHDAARHDRALSTIEGQRALWSTTTLRRTTLLPGRGVSGYVYLPIDPEARRVWIRVAIGNRQFPFWFDQTTLHDPKRRG